MEKLDDLIPLPSMDSINQHLHSARSSTMLQLLGKPGLLTEDCSAPDIRLVKRLQYGIDVGPFSLSGLDYALDSLKSIFLQVKEDRPDIYQAVKEDGMLCVRRKRTNPLEYSNHSWGTAIDLFFGSAVVKQGVRFTHRGVFLLAKYFNAKGWYWGAGFSGNSVDSMHFELAEETVHNI